MSAGAAPTFSIDLPVQPEWANAERLRASVQSCLLAAGCTSDASNAVAVVTAELAENAVKYGAYSAGAPTFRIRITGDRIHAKIVVESPIIPGDPGTARLFEILRWIGSFPSAAEAYRARLLEIAGAAPTEPGAPTSSSNRLGLVRLVYEASCSLGAELDGDLLRITGELPL